MKLKDVKAIWVFVDEYGDIDTELFYPEENLKLMPYQMEKEGWDRPEDTPKRLIVWNAE